MNASIYCTTIKNWDEYEECLLNANSVFNNNHRGGEEDLIVKRNLWKTGIENLFEHFIILKIVKTEQIIGLVRIVPINMRSPMGEIKVAGFTSIHILEEFRGKGYSRNIMEFAINKSKEIGYEMGLLFARRSADNFYTRFGFVGISNFNEVNINIGRCTPNKVSKTILSSKDANLEEIGTIKEMYESTYVNDIGSFIRSEKDWERIIMKNNQNNWSIKIIENMNYPVGYYIINDSKIVEISSFLNQNKIEVLKCIDKKETLFKFSAKSTHPFFQSLDSMEIEEHKRNCSYGGHMARVINTDMLVKKLKNKLEKDTESKTFLFREDEVILREKNSTIQINLKKPEATLTEEEIRIIICSKNFLSFNGFSFTEEYSFLKADEF